MNLFDEILNSNSKLQTDESNSLTNSENESDLTDSEESLYFLAKGQALMIGMMLKSKKKCVFICENCGKDDHYKSHCPSHNA
ncbi:hypothetical protein F8M41_017588 [Gigaspora margarita]|uniref:CCHC-type domain-containing protein n=1 Tax=Gigaspora margarita TaxID=4874 RepID=A0A8H4EM27_GIGMA|nr:hypothetical protein F8M41_017588 [Gigaspora margarita]